MRRIFLGLSTLVSFPSCITFSMRPIGRTAAPISRLLGNFERIWHRVQISHRGKYSIERLIALEEYAQTTSSRRALLVCILTPIPMLVAVLGIQFIPLQDPSLGWKVNIGLWFRAAITVLLVSFSLLNQVRLLVPGLYISRKQVAIISFITAFIYPLCCIGVAEAWMFPIPYMLVVMGLPLTIIYVVLLFVVVGRCSIRSPALRTVNKGLLMKQMQFLSAQMLLSAVYPACNAVVSATIDAGFEVIGLAMFPIIRIIMRNLMAYCISHLEDLIPEASVFTVELFSALYLSTSIQRISSIYSVVAIVILDFVHLFFSLRSLQRELAYLVGEFEAIGNGTVPSPNHSVLFVSDKLVKSEACRLAGICLESTKAYNLSAGGKFRLDAIRQQGQGTYSASLFRATPLKGAAGRPTQLGPTVCNIPENSDNQTPTNEPKFKAFSAQVLPEPPKLSTSSRERRNRVAVALQLAFRIEYIALSEYLECVVPLVWTIVLSVMVQLPGLEYYPQILASTSHGLERAVRNIFVWWTAEMLSLALLISVLHRRGRINPIYHVAFVLEKHVELVQGKLITWMTTSIALLSIHLGTSMRASKSESCCLLCCCKQG